jgi:hypothetical protein
VVLVALQVKEADVKHIGFTGTRHGMTEPQRLSVMHVMGVLDDEANRDGDLVAAHHGDCTGADEQFHGVLREYGYAAVGHPSTHNMRAFCQFDKEHERKLPLDRNAAIVSESDVMIACPYEPTEQQRGGTWATIRMARKAGKPLAIVLPDGTVQYERWTP